MSSPCVAKGSGTRFVARSCIRPRSVGALVIKQCFRTYDIPRRGTGVVGQKIETGPAVTKRRSDRSQCLASHGKLARRKTAGEQLERIHVGQAIRLDFHCRKSVPEKWLAKKRPGSVNGVCEIWLDVIAHDFCFLCRSRQRRKDSTLCRPCGPGGRVSGRKEQVFSGQLLQFLPGGDRYLCRNGNWKMALRDRRPKSAPQGPRCQKSPVPA